MSASLQWRRSQEAVAAATAGAAGRAGHDAAAAGRLPRPVRAPACGADLRGRIMAVHPETADAATIVIRPGADWPGHVPGQYVRIGVDVDGVRLWRAYSLTHGPRADGRISVTVKAVPDGKVSNHLVREGRPGTLVQLDQATGDFVLPTEGGRFLFVTAGSGITPVIGMLRDLFPVADAGVVRLARSAPYDIVVLHVAPERARLDLPANLRELDAAGLIRLISRHTDKHGMLDVADLTSSCPTWPSGSPGLRPGGPARRPAEHHDARSLPLLTERFRTERSSSATAAPSRSPAPAPSDRRRGHADPGRRRGGRRADAVRLPDGHLLRLRAPAALRAPSATCAPARSPPPPRASRERRSSSRPASPPRPAPATSTTDPAPPDRPNRHTRDRP